MSGNKWAGRKVTTARAKLAYLLPAPCYRCGVTIPSADECKAQGIQIDVDHIQSRSEGGDDSLSNYVWSHARCNRQHGQKLSTQSKAKTASVRAVETERTHKFWSEVFSSALKGSPDGASNFFLSVAVWA